MQNITELPKLIDEIEYVKTKLDNLISVKDYNLLDNEIVELSQQLDKLLVKFFISE